MVQMYHKLSAVAMVDRPELRSAISDLLH